MKCQIAVEKLNRMEPVFVEKNEENEKQSDVLLQNEIMEMKEKLERLRSIAKDKEAQINSLINSSQREDSAYGSRNIGPKNQFFMTSQSIGSLQLVF